MIVLLLCIRLFSALYETHFGIIFVLSDFLTQSEIFFRQQISQTDYAGGVDGGNGALIAISINSL
jgi:hypothetical protein